MVSKADVCTASGGQSDNVACNNFNNSIAPSFLQWLLPFCLCQVQMLCKTSLFNFFVSHPFILSAFTRAMSVCKMMHNVGFATAVKLQ